MILWNPISIWMGKYTKKYGNSNYLNERIIHLKMDLPALKFVIKTEVRVFSLSQVLLGLPFVRFMHCTVYIGVSPESMDLFIF